MRAWSAMATLIGVAMFIVVVLILHLIQSGYEARHQLISELALGQHGWAMFVAFLGLATANLGVISAIATFGGSHGYRVLLGVAALLFLTAGIFPLGATSLIHMSAIAGRASVSAPRAVSWSLAAGVAVSVALGNSVIPMGIAQRLAAACLLLWLGIVGWRLCRL